MMIPTPASVCNYKHKDLYPVKITISYTFFALLAIVANIGSQDILIRACQGRYAVSISILLGTTVGLVVKYLLDMPGFLLNRYSVSLFNALYYRWVRKTLSERRLSLPSFFFPLDGISDWNRLYGKQGFVQYQFVIPRRVGLEGLKELLQRIVSSGRASFLSVLKLFGPANENYLSFPLEGYTLALDFRLDTNVLRILDELAVDGRPVVPKQEVGCTR